MKLYPIKILKHIKIKPSSDGCGELIEDIKGNTIITFDRSQGDSVEFYSTGFYVKIDQNYSPNGKKCFVHMFFTEKGKMIVNLHDAEINNGTYYSKAHSDGCYGIEVYKNGLKIIFKELGRNNPIEMCIDYSELQKLGVFTEKQFHEKTPPQLQ